MKLIAKKSLGQHFLHSPSALKKIIDAATIKTGELVLEIGPGTGILTTELLKTGAHVIAIEKDDRAISLLQEKFKKECVRDDKDGLSGKLTLIHGDILELEQKEWVKKEIFGGEGRVGVTKNPRSQLVTSGFTDTTHLTEGNYAIVANIPYYITGAILRKFLENSPRPNRMILLVQKEVAERMVGRGNSQGKRSSGQGKPRPKKESLLSISVKAFGTPRIVAIVPRGAFVPPPTVNSAIIAIENISNKNFLENTQNSTKNGSPEPSIERFFDILHAGFAHKRKVLIRNLENTKGGIFSGPSGHAKLQKIWTDMKLSEKIRAEDVTLDQWLEIAKRF